MQNLAVIGLGYVGLPLAIRLSEKGYKVIGFEIETDKISAINSGKSPFPENEFAKELKSRPFEATSDFSLLKNVEAAFICVPTPVDERYTPDLGPLKSALETVGEYAHKGVLIIIESTIYPGITEEIALPILEKNGNKDGADFFLAHCPERIDPGNEKWNVKNLPRVVGSTTPKGADLAAELYHSFVEAKIVQLSSVKAAEATKVTENAFRDINIAFVNELAKSFDTMGIDVTEVIEAAATKPFSFLPHYPGCGVGGHCIPVDPYYLIERAKKNGFKHSFLSLAREINASMPDYTIRLLQSQLNKLERSLNRAKVAVLGLSYKKNRGDLRESPALHIVKQLRANGAKVLTYDPFLPAESNAKSLEEALTKSDYVVIATDHDEFVENLPAMAGKFGIKIIVDGKNCISADSVKGVAYKGIGR